MIIGFVGILRLIWSVAIVVCLLLVVRLLRQRVRPQVGQLSVVLERVFLAIAIHSAITGALFLMTSTGIVERSDFVAYIYAGADAIRAIAYLMLARYLFKR